MILNSRLKARGIFILSVVLSFQKCCGNLASGKLDFGDSSTETSVEHDLKSSQSIKQTTILDKTSAPSGSHVISCIGTGCNFTNAENDTVDTIVVLQVKTKINSEQNHKNKDYDVKDVPVSIGYNSPGLDQTLEDRNRPNDFPNRADFDNSVRFGRFPPPHYGSDQQFSPGNIARPPYSFTSRPNYDEIHSRSGFDPYNRHDGFQPLAQDNHRVTPHVAGFQNRPGYLPFHQPYGGSFDRRENKYHPRNNYDYNENPYALLRNAMNSLLNPYQQNSNSEININVKGLTPLAVTLTDKNGSNKFTENGVELRIPHFEPTANKHYFGDESPPHSVWSPKTSNYNPTAYNPVAFKTNQQSKSFNAFFDIFKPNTNISKDNNSNFQTRNHRHIGPRCPCNDHNIAASGRRDISYSDPGAHISDKLAALN